MNTLSKTLLVLLLGCALGACGAQRPGKGGGSGGTGGAGSGGSGGSDDNRDPTYDCVDECDREGRNECTNEVAIRMCGNFDLDSCLEWSEEETCGIGHICDVTTNQCIIPECQGFTSGCGGTYGDCCEGLHCCDGDCYSPSFDGWCLREVGQYADAAAQCVTNRWNAESRKCTQ